MNLKRVLQDEKGSVLPLTAMLIASVFLGFSALVVDVGMLYAERQQMVTAADAAALAGANILADSYGLNREEALASAIDIAVRNGADVDKVKTPVIDFSEQTVTVEVGTTETLFFAKALGFKEASIAAKAVAKWDYENHYNEELIDRDLLPFFVFETDYQLGKFYLHDNLGDGSWGMYRIPNHPSNNYDDVLVGTVTIELFEDDIEELKGLRLGQFKNGVVSRIDESLDIADTLERERHLQALVPIVDTNRKIQAFAIYQIEDFIKQGNGGTILGSLIEDNLQVGTIVGSFISDPIPAWQKVKMVYLIE